MRFTLFIISLLFLSFCEAQKSLSYISDRKFNDPTELLGYNFRPSTMEIKDVKKQNLVPGSVAFGITQNNLFVEGEGITGVYNVNNINSTEFGYKLLLMNARDATLQGHLKIILNKKREAEALIFLRSSKDKEMIFFLSPLPNELAKKEKDYFTDKEEKVFFHPDSLWGKQIRPFLVLHQKEKVQERLEMRDSMIFSFKEKVTIIDKTKKKDKEKKKEDVVEKVEIDEHKKEDKTTPPQKIDPKNIKIVKEHFAYIRQILKYDDGTVEDKETEYQIKSYSMKEDKNMSYEGDRYLLLLETNKGDINIFLNGNKAVNSIEFNGNVYLMRGF
jgi:hypothetical protein